MICARAKLALMTALLACACSRRSVKVDAPLQAPRLVRGVDSYRDALARLGPPAEIRALRRGFSFRYSSLRFREWRLRLSYQRLATSYATGERAAEGLVLVFDAEGLLREKRGVAESFELGWGGLFGHSYMDEPFYGRRNYGPLAGLHRWSGEQLRSNPRPLSRHQDPNPNTRPRDPESDEGSESRDGEE